MDRTTIQAEILIGMLEIKSLEQAIHRLRQTGKGNILVQTFSIVLDLRNEVFLKAHLDEGGVLTSQNSVGGSAPPGSAFAYSSASYPIAMTCGSGQVNNHRVWSHSVCWRDLLRWAWLGLLRLTLEDHRSRSDTRLRGCSRPTPRLYVVLLPSNPALPLRVRGTILHTHPFLHLSLSPFRVRTPACCGLSLRQHH